MGDPRPAFLENQTRSVFIFAPSDLSMPSRICQSQELYFRLLIIAASQPWGPLPAQSRLLKHKTHPAAILTYQISCLGVNWRHDTCLVFEGEVSVQRKDLKITLLLRKVVVVIILILLTDMLLILGCVNLSFQAECMFRVYMHRLWSFSPGSSVLILFALYSSECLTWSAHI